VTGIEAAEGGAEIISAGTALLRFFAAVTNGAFECSRIYSVTAGYHYHSSGPLGDGVLSPVWLITADTGRYIVDGAGEPRALP